MNTSLAHLSASARAKLDAIVPIIREAAEVELIILFGSYARGDQVRLDVETGYRSDFDILVVVKSPKLADDLALWSQAEARAEALPGMTPITLIVHDFEFVRNKIEYGQYFFNDIRREGVLLHTSGRYTLPEPRVLSTTERKQQAMDDFAEWLESADEFYATFEFNLGRQSFKIAAFQLHQATERYYTAFLLVFTAYKPRIHNIEKLGKQAGDLSAALRDVFPRATPEDDALFKKLKHAYVDARYSKNYSITEEELKTLAARVKVLRERTEAACRERIATLG